MHQILEYLDQIIEIEKGRDAEFCNLLHQLNRSSETLGESPLSVHLKRLKELLMNEMGKTLSPKDMLLAGKEYKIGYGTNG